MLATLVRVALHTMPLPTSVGGVAYGACGALLFHMLLMTSAKSTSGDAAATLIHFFLVHVARHVREERERELVDGTAGGGGGSVVDASAHARRAHDDDDDDVSKKSSSDDASGSGNNNHDRDVATSAPRSRDDDSTGERGRRSRGGGGKRSTRARHADDDSRRSRSSGGRRRGGGAGGNAEPLDVFLYNLSHFTELIVDMLAINILELARVQNFFVSLLVLTQSWSHAFTHRLSAQVMRACVAVLNRPNTLDASVELVEAVHTLCTLVLRPGWLMKDCLEQLLRVLYRVYASLPPVWMHEVDVQRRRHVVVLTLRHLMRTYRDTDELRRALTVHTLTQHFSLYEAWAVMLLLQDDVAVSCGAFDAYCAANAVPLETWLSGRLKKKADAAFKACILARSEYIKRIGAFNARYAAVAEVKAGGDAAALQAQYAREHASRVASPPTVDAGQLQWLLRLHDGEDSDDDDNDDDEGDEDDDNTTLVQTYHSYDAHRNVVTVRKLRATTHGVDDKYDDDNAAVAAAAAPQMTTEDDVKDANGSDACGGGGGDGDALVRTLLYDDDVEHVAALVPPYALCSYAHNRHAGAAATSSSSSGGDGSSSNSVSDKTAWPSYIDKHVTTPLQPSALTLLRYLLAPGEQLRFISNCFRVHGIHATPGLLLLSDRTLKVISFSCVTADGELVLCQREEESDNNSTGSNSNSGRDTETSPQASSSVEGGGSGSKRSGHGGGGGGAFSFATMARHLQRLLSDDRNNHNNNHNNNSGGGGKQRAKQTQQDGTRVVQSMRQTTERSYRHVYWCYRLHAIREVRCVRYMHLDTAVTLHLLHEDGPMLSIVDATQSMNASARGEFVRVLKSLLPGPHAAASFFASTPAPLPPSSLSSSSSSGSSGGNSNSSNNNNSGGGWPGAAPLPALPWCVFAEDAQRATTVRTMLVRWAAGAVSTYDYLHFLNAAAGRTTRDFSQYPVFPWVLADYTSATLTLPDGSNNSNNSHGGGVDDDSSSSNSNSSVYRDLTLPMGAQTDARRRAVAQLYANTSEACESGEAGGGSSGGTSSATGAGGCDSAFHHGTHYSTSGGVLYYLLRVQPFATFAQLFQGGSFDKPARLFDSVAAAYASCVNGPADCKELLPEFYATSGSSGSFLRNRDHLALGVKPDGTAVHDVQLPPWAHGSAQVFCAVLRYALESEHVRQRIHHWIDLVFGVRRRGPLAVARYNVFQRLTYGEEVTAALRGALTPRECDVLVAVVDNFGQTPMQLFQERHPAHRELAPVRATTVVSANNNNNSNSATRSSSGGSGAAAATSPQLVQQLFGSNSNNSTVTTTTTTTTTATGNTYTLAFEAHVPKTLPMLMRALDTPPSCFHVVEPRVLLASSASHGGHAVVSAMAAAGPVVAAAIAAAAAAVASSSSSTSAAAAALPPLLPMPPCLLEYVQVHDNAVQRLVLLRGVGSSSSHAATRVLACCHRRLVWLDKTCVDAPHRVLCWHESEPRLQCCTFASSNSNSSRPVWRTVFALPRDDAAQRITAVAASARGLVVLVGTSSGSIYCLCTSPYGDGCGSRHDHSHAAPSPWLEATSVLWRHRHAIAGIDMDPETSRAVSYTSCASSRRRDDDDDRHSQPQQQRDNTRSSRRSDEDMPVVWRVHRHRTLFAHRLDVAALLPGSAAEERVVVHACIDRATAHTLVLTRRSLLVFDAEGAPFAMGTLPMPPLLVSPSPTAAAMLPPAEATASLRAEAVRLLDDDSADLDAAVDVAGTATTTAATTVAQLRRSFADGRAATRAPPATTTTTALCGVPFIANMTVVCAYDACEWAAGMKLFLTGHQDGTLSLWRLTRLPPDAVAPGRLAVVRYHAALLPHALDRATMTMTTAGVVTSARSSSPVRMHGNDDYAALGAVTTIVQERPDVPRWALGYESGAVRYLVFDEYCSNNNSNSSVTNATESDKSKRGSGGGGGGDGGSSRRGKSRER